MKKKVFLGLLIAFLLLGGAYYKYASSLVTNPFSIDFSETKVESAASSLIGTSQTYSFRLQNISDKSIKLIGAKLDGFNGIKVGPISTQNKLLNNLVIPSSRVYNSDGWSTDNKGIICNYDVVIEKPKISNPQRVILTYELLGIKHQQTVELPNLIEQ